MNKAQFQLLLQNSDIFRQLDRETRDYLMGLEGDLMEDYARIFQQAYGMEKKLKQEFIEENLKVYQSFDAGLKEHEKKIKAVSEQISQAEDEAAENVLLNQMDDANVTQQ